MGYLYLMGLSFDTVIESFCLLLQSFEGEISSLCFYIFIIRCLINIMLKSQSFLFFMLQKHMISLYIITLAISIYKSIGAIKQYITKGHDTFLDF